MPLAATTVDGPVFVVNAFEHAHCATAVNKRTTPKQRDLSEEELQKLLERIANSKHSIQQQQQAKQQQKQETKMASADVCQARNNSVDSGVLSVSESSTSSSSSLAELELCSGMDKLNVLDKLENKENIGTKKPPSMCKKHHVPCSQKSAPVTSAESPISSVSSKSSSGHGKWLSPQEYFQLSRLRSTALASKLGGNSCSVLLLDCSEIPRPNLDDKASGQEKADLDKVAEGIKGLALDGDKQKSPAATDEAEEPQSKGDETEDKSKEATEDQDSGVVRGELIDRGPIPVARNNNAYAPYDNQQHQRFAGMEQQNSFFNSRPMNNNVFVNKSPMDFFAMQKQKQGAIALYGVPQAVVGNAAYQVQPSPRDYSMVAQGDAPEAQGYRSPPHGYMMEEMHGSPYEMNMVEFNMSMQEQMQAGYVDIVPAASNAPHPEYLYQAAAACDFPGSPDSYTSSCFMRDDMQNMGYNGGNCGSPQNAPSVQLSPNSAHSADNMPSPFADEHLSTSELNRILNASEELPDSLSDFILKYSRRYSTDTPCSDASSMAGGRKISNDESSVGSLSAAQSPFSNASDSPPSSGHPSPQPRQSEKIRASVAVNNSNNNGAGAAPNGQKAQNTVNKPAGAQRYKPIRPKQSVQRRSNVAKDKLRATISDKDFEVGWAWALRCSQAGPSALYFRDQDGDSLLHIVIWHKDIPKVLGLVEMMMRDEGPPYCRPFDLPNRMDETPLFLAVEKRLSEVAAYLLECGADPNRRTRNRDCDAPIHYAAARGMSEIVAALASSGKCDLNLVNGCGITPLICAVKNHGVIEEESQCLVNNKPTIRALLKHGADPKIPDAASGKTVLHYAVERMDPDLVEIFRDNMGKEEMLQLVNSAMYNGDTPLHLLSYLSSQQRGTFTRAEGEEDLRRKMFLTLVNCGADVNLPNAQGQCPIQPPCEI